MSATTAVAGPFAQRMKARAKAIRERPPVAQPEPVATRAGSGAELLAFWQSPVVKAEINRRVTGDPQVRPEAYFAQRHAAAVPAEHALSLRAGDARLEAALVRGEGACVRVTGLDTDAKRAQSTNEALPETLRNRIRFQQGDLMRWEPREPLGAVVARSVLHRQADLEGALDRVAGLLAPGGLVFVDEFVGPNRFQWSDAQLDAINRMLACLPDGLLIDLHAGDGRHKRKVSRPNAAAHAAANPEDAVCSERIVGCLDERFERVEVSLYGGAVYHQLFTRIIGNFSTAPELVRVLMGVDALLTDTGVVGSDYVWGVWRKRVRRRRWWHARA